MVAAVHPVDALLLSPTPAATSRRPVQALAGAALATFRRTAAARDLFGMRPGACAASCVLLQTAIAIQRAADRFLGVANSRGEG
jgi:hypothetical protein